MEKEALHDMLCRVLGDTHCYFQPPASIQMSYPCIVYHIVRDDRWYADNIPYKTSKVYTITIIDEDPDSKIPDRLVDAFPYCSLDRVFATEGLSHFVYMLYFNGSRVKDDKDENNKSND